MLLDVGENHVELLAPLGRDTPVGKFLAKRGPRHAPRRLPDDRHRRRARAPQGRRHAAHRRGRPGSASAARASPSCIPKSTGWRAHRDRPARGGSLRIPPWPSASPSASTPARPLALRVTERGAREAAEGARHRGLARGRRRGRHRQAQPPARPVAEGRQGRAARGLRPQRLSAARAVPAPGLDALADVLSGAISRPTQRAIVRGAARRPRSSPRAPSSALGEHAACWLALGAAGAALDAPRRARWLRALAGVGGAYASTSRSSTSCGRARPQRRRPRRR